MLSGQLDVSLDWLFSEEIDEIKRKIFIQNTNNGNDVGREAFRLDNNLIQAAVQDLYNPADQRRVLTGYTNVDEFYEGGLHRGQTYFITGAPGVGKTTFALNISNHLLGRK